MFVIEYFGQTFGSHGPEIAGHPKLVSTALRMREELGAVKYWTIRDRTPEFNVGPKGPKRTFSANASDEIPE